jgi:hypothetical protein
MLLLQTEEQNSSLKKGRKYQESEKGVDTNGNYCSKRKRSFCRSKYKVS